MNIFVGTLPEWVAMETMQFHNANLFIIEEQNVLPLSDLIEPFDMNKKCS